MSGDNKSGHVLLKKSKFELPEGSVKVFNKSCSLYGKFVDDVLPKIRESLERETHVTNEAFDLFKEFLSNDPVQLIGTICKEHADKEAIVKEANEQVESILDCIESIKGKPVRIKADPRTHPTRENSAFKSCGMDNRNTHANQELLQMNERFISCSGKVKHLGGESKLGTMTKLEESLFDDSSVYWLMVMSLDVFLSNYMFKTRTGDVNCKLGVCLQDTWIKPRFYLYMQTPEGEYVKVLSMNDCGEILPLMQKASPLGPVDVVTRYYRIASKGNEVNWNTAQDVLVPREGENCAQFYEDMKNIIRNRDKTMYKDKTAFQAIYPDEEDSESETDRPRKKKGDRK